MSELIRRELLKLTALAGAAIALPRKSWALDFPTHPITIIVGFPAASATDVVARLIANALGPKIGQQVVVENRPGAGSNIGAQTVAQAAPDGYELLAMTITNAVNATLYPDLTFNIITDFAPIIATFKAPLVMVVSPNLPSLGVRSVPDLIAYAKAHPGKLNYASFGNGSAPHINGELFKLKTGINMVHVPYRGSPVPDLLAGQVQVLIAPMPVVIGQIRSGKLPALAVTSPEPSEALPGVPPMAKFIPGYDTSIWHGIEAPKGTPQDIIEKLNKDINAVLREPSIKARFAENGGVPLGGSPADLAALIVSEKKKWADVIKAAHIKLMS